ncbi:MAG TPA: heat-inducible transcription repressor HrcA [candidate division Zixibacteria bacterium]|nr:heat-inducible transcription repressor HrcA [candidate division Zixibacteria bacterium]
MPKVDLSARELQVLNALIDCYIKTAEPVGSRKLATKYNLGVSPATIRNTLQDLEEMGLVYQPHTSAGRIPTEVSYRIYVDNIMQIRPLTNKEKAQIARELTSGNKAIDQILEQSCRVLSEVSMQLGVSMAPRFTEGILTHLDLVPVGENRLLVVAAVKSGLVRSVVMEVDSVVNPKMVQETADILNERLSGLTLGQIIDTIHDRFRDVSYGDPKLIKLFTESAENIFTPQTDKDLHLMGTPNITSQPEFKDPKRLQELISLIEERQKIVSSLNAAAIYEGVVVTIGKEANLGMLDGCSMVTSTYRAGKTTGTIGVIGPTRMEYSKLMSIVDYTSKVLSRILSKE